MSSERKAFEDAIAKDRYDEATRKVFADWLSENGFDDEAAVQYAWTRERQEAEDWLRDFAEQAGGTIEGYDGTGGDEKYQPITYETVLQAAAGALSSYREAVERGEEHPEYWTESFTQYGSSSARDLLNSKSNREKFWRCYALVTGDSVEKGMNEVSAFGCSC